MLRDVLTGLLELLSPARCVGCDLPDALATDAFCGGCSPLLEPAPSTLQPPASDAALLCYQGPIADAIRRFKYAKQSQLAGPLSDLLAATAPNYVGLLDAVVPMPLHPRKLRSRGFNPAVLLGRPLAAALQVPLQLTWLKRERHTHSQAGLAHRDRAQNVRGAFAVRPVEPCRVLLLDDVRTTGATLAEAAAALRARGHTVRTLALAWAPPSAV